LFLDPTPYLDGDHPRVRAFALEASAGEDPLEAARRLYLAVRDGFLYDPYSLDLTAAGLRASGVIERGRGYCVTKAVLLAAAARVAGIPARIGFADVRNHLASQRLLDLMGTDVFYWHGYAELWLDDRWVKATPAFNATLCAKLGVAPLEFDGRRDSILQPTDARGQKFMEYVLDRGPREDVPLEELREGMFGAYPFLRGMREKIEGDLAAEVERERT
jgi:transglutaminase-like putative cysteine protease